ncbi:MAG: dCTP deaminase [Fimbriimonadaceae bacterium]|nr:dCTP deaminase [Fimbriimonadaceae bacterium]
MEGSSKKPAGRLSVGGLLYQAECLVERLAAFTDDEYPAQTLAIARILRLLAERCRSELSKLETAAANGLPAGEENRARDLGNIVQALHSYLRYLQASAPLQTPPGIQQAITALIEKHAIEVLECDRQDINVLVRPQWRYSLKYVDILHQFDTDTNCVLWYALDPSRELQAYEVRGLVEALGRLEKRAGDEGSSKHPEVKIPKHIAVLSFAGLDRDDVLLYPLLAHELGHFLDFASEDRESASTASTVASFLPTPADFEKYGLDPEDHRTLAENASVCLRELTADLLATRMVGLGYYFAFNEYFKSLDVWTADEYINSKSGYPSFALRLKLIWEELSEAAGGTGAVERLRALLQSWRPEGKERLIDYLEDSESRARAIALPPEAAIEGSSLEKLQRLTINTVVRSIPAVVRLARQIIPDARVAQVPGDVEDMVTSLRIRVPPFQPLDRGARRAKQYSSWMFEDVLTAGWLYQLAIGDEAESKLEQRDRVREYRSTCLLLLKALELQDSAEAIQAILRENKKEDKPEKPSGPQPGSRGGVLSGPSVRAALDRPSDSDRLVICPDFGDGPIEAASRDLHLGHWFRVFKRTSLVRIDLSKSADIQRARARGQAEVFVPSGSDFVLQPGDFALAISLEYVCLPPDVMAFVEGKSSLGRAGLIIATATQVAPGFKGCIVLELFNAGTVPIIIKPAMRVAQLVLVSTDTNVSSEWLYSGNFQVQIRP